MNTLERALELAAREMENGEQVMAISGAGSVAWQPAMSLAAAIAWAAKNATAQIVYVIEEKAGGGWRAFSTGKAGKGEAAARLAAHRNGISRYTGALSSYRVRIGVVPGGPGTLNLRQVERTLIRDSRNISRGMRDRGSDTKPFEVPKGGSVSITHTGPCRRSFKEHP